MQDRKTGGARPIGQSAGCRTDADRAVSETLQLYHAWLGYLLRRLGQDEVRVPAAELRQALGHLACRVRREGGDYVISFAADRDGAAGADARAGKEGAGDGAERNPGTGSYTPLRGHETVLEIVCRLLLETKKFY